jgi:predicted MFS family arabinose efflux permease
MSAPQHDEAGRRSTGWLAPTLLMTAAAGLSQGFARLTFGVVLPDMRADIVGSYGVAGVLGGANLIGYLAGALLTAPLVARMRTTTVLKLGVVVALVGLLVVAVSPSIGPLFVGMIVLGVSSGVIWIACVPIVSTHAPADRRGLAYGLMMTGVGIGIAGAGGIARLVDVMLGPGSWRAVWLVELAIGAAILVLLQLVLRPTDHPAEIAAGAAAGVGLAAAAARAPRLTWVYVCYLCYGFSHGLFTGFLVAALHDDAGLTVGQAAGAYSLLGLGNIAGGVVLGRASDRWGRRPLLVVAMLIIAGCAAVIPFGVGGLGAASAATYGLVMSGMATIMTAYVSDVLTPAQLAGGFVAITMAVGAGQLISPPIGGALADAFGSFDLTYVVCAAVAVLGAAAALRLTGRRVAHTEPVS